MLRKSWPSPTSSARSLVILPLSTVSTQTRSRVWANSETSAVSSMRPRAAIARVQAKIEAIAAGAAEDVKVLVVGNPANTNCLIAMSNADGLPRERFTAMVRLDHNRAIAQVAKRTGAGVSEISQMTIWGNHSTTQYPDLFNARVKGESAWDAVGDESWVAEEFIPTVAERGAAIIDARGASSAASAANAAIDHVRDWVLGTPDGDWVSMAIPSDGSYDVEEGLISGFPCTCAGGTYEIVHGLEVPEFSRTRIDASVDELKQEREAVKDLL